MLKLIFGDLIVLLTQQYELCGSRRTHAREVLAITLHILGHNMFMRHASEGFQHSTKTISRYIAKGINAIKRLFIDVITPLDLMFSHIPPQILNDGRYMSCFKYYIGAIDETHVDTRVSIDQQVSYIGRGGTTTHNVMPVCDFNMCSIFIMVDLKGSTHDSCIFQHALMDPSYNFFYPPPGKYYLVDVGYPLQRGFMKPYCDTRYYLPNFDDVKNSTTHSSLHSVIERSFGVRKK